ncbi:MAG: sodium:solute symporter [Clostridia bacterium]|nr:sodium:solute symporter [Clostridia bacterium]
MEWFYAGVLVLYFFIMIYIGYRARSSANSVGGFVLGGRNVGPWLSAFAYGTSYFSAVIFIGYAGQFGWKFGVGSTWIGIGNALIGSLLAWKLLGSRTRSMTQRLGSATMPDFFGKRFGDNTLKIIASIIIFVFLIPYTASLYKGLGGLFEMAFNIPYPICIAIMAVVTAVYVLIGGYMATAWNDFIQGIIMLFGIVVVIVAVISTQGGLSQALEALGQVSATGIPEGSLNSVLGPDLYGLIMVVILTSLGTWGLPQMTQKFYAIKDDGAVKKGMIISTIFALVVAGGCYFLGGFGRLFDNPDLYTSSGAIRYDAIIPTMLSGLHPAVIALVLVLVVSASMSTLSSLVMTSSSTITLDLIKGKIKPEISQKGQMNCLRTFVAIFVVISAVIAIVYEMSGLSFIAQMMGVSWGALAGSFLAPYLYSLYSKKVTRTATLTCFIFGVLVSVVSFVISMTPALKSALTGTFIYDYVFVSPIYVGAWTMLISLVIVPIVSAFTKKPSQEVLDEAFGK